MNDVLAHAVKLDEVFHDRRPHELAVQLHEHRRHMSLFQRVRYYARDGLTSATPFTFLLPVSSDDVS